MYSQILMWSGIVLLALVLVRGCTRKMLREYAPFYAYVAFSLLATLSLAVVIPYSGVTGKLYYHTYYAEALAIPLFYLWILVALYRRIKGAGERCEGIRGIPVWLAVISVLAGWKFFQVSAVGPDGGLLFKVNALTLPIAVVGCILVHRMASLHREVRLGRNFSGILTGLSILVGFQTINFTIFCFGGPSTQSSGSSFQILSFLSQFTYFAALVIFAYTLWDYAPMRKVERVDPARVAEVNDQLQQTIKALILSR